MKHNRLFCLIACASMCSFLFTGCKGNYDSLLDKDAPCAVTVWHYYNGIQQTQFDEMVKEFNNTIGSEQGIVVEAYSKNSIEELAKSVEASVNKEPGAEEAPDIFATYAETAYKIDKQGSLADLSKYFTAEELEEYIDEYIKEGAFSGEGTLKIFPTAKSTEVMILNTTDWKEFAESKGITYENLRTWEGLAAVAEQYYQYTDALTPDIPNDGKAFFGRDSIANYLTIGAKQLGHAFASISEDGTVNVEIDKQTIRKLWDYFYVPYVKGYYTSESRFRSDDVKIGAIIAMVCSTTGASYYPAEVTINDEYSYPIENIVLPIPNFEGCAPYIVQQGAGLSVLASEEKTEYACTVFLKWLTEAERNIEFSVNSGYLPVKKTANDFNVISESGSLAGSNDIMFNTLKTAIDEINSYTLYTSPPYDESADVRNYFGDIFEDTAKAAYAAAWAEIGEGADRETILGQYTNDAAFEKGFTAFEKGFQEILGG